MRKFRVKKVVTITMKRLVFPVFVVFTLFFVSGCGGCGKTGGSEGTNSVSQAGPDLSMIKIKIGDKVVLDSPEKFVEINILFNYEHLKWIRDINSNTNLAGSGEEYLSKKGAEFYKSLGLTEEAIIQYGSLHFKEIAAFLDKNPVLKKAYEDSQN